MAQNSTLLNQCFFNATNNLSSYRHPFVCSFLDFNVTTCQPLQTSEEKDTVGNICLAADIVEDVGFWFSLITGTIGNSLAIITVWSLPKSPATFYVGLLAASDLMALFVSVMTDSVINQWQVFMMGGVMWNLLTMLFNFCASFSNWLLVLICLERLFTVRFPLKKGVYFTIRHAHISAIVLGLSLFTIYNVMTWTLGYTDLRIFTYRNLLYAYIPLALILIIIALISVQLNRIHKDRKLLNGSVHSRIGLSRLEDQPPADSDPRTKRRQKKKTTLEEIARLENSITVMMFVAAVCFSVLTIPNCILMYTYRDFSLSFRTPLMRARWKLFQKISYMLTFLNLSVNFVLYFLSSKRFRTQLYRVILPRTLSIRKSLTKSHQDGIDCSNSDSIPLHPDVSLMVSPNLKDNTTTTFALDSATATPEHQTRQKHLSETYPILYSEINGHAGTGI